jgi:hypothetical protein
LKNISPRQESQVLGENSDISKSVMNGVPSNQIGGFKNEQWENNAALFRGRDRFPNGPFGERTLHRKIPSPPRALLTVFSTTQSDHSITPLRIHDITDLEIHPEIS